MLIDNFWIDELEKIRLRNDIYQKEVQIKNLVDRNDKLFIENEKLTLEIDLMKKGMREINSLADRIDDFSLGY